MGNQKIDFDSYVPYYIQLIDAIKERIEIEEMKPGDQLPSEPDLCEIYGVSRTVVRQALRELELEGLVVRRKGKGTFVAEPKIGESLVQSLTGFFEDMIARGHTPITQILKFEIVPASAKIAQYLQLEPGTEVYQFERLRSVEDEPIVLVTTYLPCGTVPDLEQFDLETQSLYAILENAYGVVLARGRRTVEAVAANEYEARLLQIEEGDPLILLDSITYLDDGTPIEYYHAVHRGDRSRFEVELVRLPEQEKSLRDIIQANDVALPRSN